MSDKYQNVDIIAKNAYNTGEIRFSRLGMEAIKRVAAGTASAHEQKLCIETICFDIAGFDKPSFVPDNTHLTAYNEGKRQIGLTLKGFIDAGKIKKIEDIDDY